MRWKAPCDEVLRPSNEQKDACCPSFYFRTLSTVKYFPVSSRRDYSVVTSSLSPGLRAPIAPRVDTSPVERRCVPTGGTGGSETELVRSSVRRRHAEGREEGPAPDPVPEPGPRRQRTSEVGLDSRSPLDLLRDKPTNTNPTLRRWDLSGSDSRD